MESRGSLPCLQDPTTGHSWARWIHSMPSNPISLRSILILSSHLCLGLPRGLFPSGFLTEILRTFLIPYACYVRGGLITNKICDLLSVSLFHLYWIVKYHSVIEGFIADMFTWDGLFDISDESLQQRDNEPSDLVDKSCSCEGPSCNCCLDFNLTYIDLGGPGK